ncbi:hypothetical protein [Sporolactobacillus pectinivorans]|uniref:hypothetical protein n=1 Tax=Sporolactobacillus pectinivorans TaxID=1591408 RepID=UPI0012FD30E0|nr:hypothetical protein [Sporolactobacillus pectinivorans]
MSLDIFGLSSMLCAYATSPAILIVYRCTLALGAATLIPTSMSIIPVLFAKGTALLSLTTASGIQQKEKCE